MAAGTWGRPPGPTDPMFKKNGPAPDRLGAPSIDAQVNKLLHRTGLRQPAPGERRYKVPALHGFRRFWNKTMKDAISDDSPVSSLTKKEYMMGHAGMTALDRNYYHAHTLELAREYINAVPDLTIDDAERLRAENRGLKQEMLKAGREGAARMAELEGIVSSFLPPSGTAPAGPHAPRSWRSAPCATGTTASTPPMSWLRAAREW